MRRLTLVLALLLLLQPLTLIAYTVQREDGAALVVGTIDAPETEVTVTPPPGWCCAATVVLSGTQVLQLPLTNTSGVGFGVVTVRGGGVTKRAYLYGHIAAQPPPHPPHGVWLPLVRR